MLRAHHLPRYGLQRLCQSAEKMEFLECNSLSFRQSYSNLTIMDRLSGSPSLMLVSDLDCTMVDHDDSGNNSLLRFNALWEAYYRNNSLLVFSTGRSPMSYQQLKRMKPLLSPDITIMSVGTEIAYGESMIPDDAWKVQLDKKWSREIVLEETVKFPELNPQSEKHQRPHKVSFFVEKEKAMDVMKILSQRLDERGLDVKLVYSNAIALDVLPKGAGKGQALAYLLEKLEHEHKAPLNTLVCGDSGNDAELFTVPEVHGVMVSNSHEELLQWHGENVKNNLKIFHATERCAAGIIQAINKFNLGPNVSPRDIINMETSETEASKPALKVVRLYLFQERWRRAEVEQSAQNMQYLKSFFHPLGTVVHPSGVERPLHECVNKLEAFYGDKQGTRYQIWLDKVSSELIGSASWVVRFDKWESSGEEAKGCVTKIWLSLKSEEHEERHGLRCIHMHQAWLDGSSTTKSSNETWF